MQLMPIVILGYFKIAILKSYICCKHVCKHIDRHSVWLGSETAISCIISSSRADDHLTMFCESLVHVIKLDSPIRCQKRLLFSVVQCRTKTTCYSEENPNQTCQRNRRSFYFYDKFSWLRSQCKRLANEC